MELQFADTFPPDDVKPPSSGNIVKPQPPPSLKTKQCRYGQACSRYYPFLDSDYCQFLLVIETLFFKRPDCKFWHPELEETTTACNEDISNKCANKGLSWIPHQVYFASLFSISSKSFM